MVQSDDQSAGGFVNIMGVLNGTPPHWISYLDSCLELLKPRGGIGYPEW